jgi:hypothetical protein
VRRGRWRWFGVLVRVRAGWRVGPGLERRGRRGGEAGLQGVRREWGVHGEPVAEGFGLEFFHEADEMKGGGLAAVFELTKPKNGNG